MDGRNTRQAEHAETIKTLVCRGLDRKDILAYAREKAWREEPADLDHLIEIANDELAKDAGELDTEIELGKALARLNHLYQQTVKVQDYKTALQIQKEINNVLKLKVTAEKLRAPQRTTNAPAERPRLKIVTK
jgi:hypothetical protein